MERLAQSTPGQRQTVVNVLCAYLRMPYLHPEPFDAGAGETSGSEASSAETGGANPEPDLELERRTQELQVRLAAQTILAAHLRAGPDPRHWPGTDLNLSGAVLVELDFTDCHLREADFIAARFVGDARFTAARFVGNAWFGDAEFSGDAVFEKAEFDGDARFEKAEFDGDARFEKAEFSGDAWFEKAKFGRVARFGNAEFSGDVRFMDVMLGQGGVFDGAEFARADAVLPAPWRLVASERPGWFKATTTPPAPDPASPAPATPEPGD